MKPITYWVQNDAINELVDLYGTHLEKLSPDIRRDVIASLAHECNYYEGQIPEVDAAYAVVESLTRHEKDLLIAAIAATLTHQGNPWVENARANVALAQAQTTGTPNH